jgi:D-xylonolactonase
VAFGGADLRTAYITTAWKGMTQEERAAQPLAGDLFGFEAPAPGVRPVEVQDIPTAEGRASADGGDLS